MTVGMIAGAVVAVTGLVLSASGVYDLVSGGETDFADLLVGGFMILSGLVIYLETKNSSQRR